MIAIGAGTVACSGAHGTLQGEGADAEQADRARHHYDRPAYLLFTGEGEPAGYDLLLQAARNSDIILFGELHNEPIAHWLRLELARDLHADTTRQLVIGMEMFEADQQVLLDEYLDGIIRRQNFEQEARLWGNYATDYRPLVAFARESGIPVIATNIPRRYASLVYHQGPDSLDRLSAGARNWIGPLPIPVDLELPGYKRIHEAAMHHGGAYLAHSQASKDATMAHFILKQHEESRPRPVRTLHANGTYHSDNYEGIYWYLRHYRFQGSIMTVSTSRQADLPKPGHPLPDDHELPGRADFLLMVPERMTRTH
ncbi:MAG: iron-regulated protein [Balneolaceae bacterium]|nr:MAG: iron-regulated protein [Balneolaceae bacterium]